MFNLPNFSETAFSDNVGELKLKFKIDLFFGRLS